MEANLPLRHALLTQALHVLLPVYVGKVLYKLVRWLLTVEPNKIGSGGLQYVLAYTLFTAFTNENGLDTCDVLALVGHPFRDVYLVYQNISP